MQNYRTSTPISLSFWFQKSSLQSTITRQAEYGNYPKNYERRTATDPLNVRRKGNQKGTLKKFNKLNHGKENISGKQETIKKELY